MNVYSLETEVLAQIGLTEPDANDRTEFRNIILSGLNEAYRKVCREKAHLWVVEAVTLDADKCFDMTSLANRLTKILKISMYQDYSSAISGGISTPLYWYREDGTDSIYIPAATASGTVYVKYEYMPEMLGPTYNIKGANTLKVIPVDEAISSAKATALAGQTLYLVDVSTGLYTAYTIASAAAGVAGAATITVSETISTATADGDLIYIVDNWEPKFNEDYHKVLAYWATFKVYTTRGANYVGTADYWRKLYEAEAGYIEDSIGEPQYTKKAYSKFGNRGNYINPLS